MSYCRETGVHSGASALPCSAGECLLHFVCWKTRADPTNDGHIYARRDRRRAERSCHLLRISSSSARNLQGQYARMHNRMAGLPRIRPKHCAAADAWRRFLGIKQRATSAGSWPHTPSPITGLLLSAIGFSRQARRQAGDWSPSTAAPAVLDSRVRPLRRMRWQDPTSTSGWLHIGRDPTGVSDKLGEWNQRRPRIETRAVPVAPDDQAGERGGWPRPPRGWNPTTSWRWEPLSVTRLPAALSLAFFVIWLIVLDIRDPEHIARAPNSTGPDGRRTAGAQAQDPCPVGQRGCHALNW